MSRPRPAYPGRILMLTRRCTQRMFLLRPSKEVNRIIAYCLAEAAGHCEMEVLWFAAQANHIHFGIYDKEGVYPVFIQRLHKNIATLLNVAHGRWENLWASEQTSVVHCTDPKSVFEKMIYSLTNFVKDQIVARAFDWPGVSSLPKQLADAALTETRPVGYFADGTAMPEEVSLRFSRPHVFDHLSHEQWADMIRAAVHDVERKAAEEREQTGRRVLGRKAVLAQSPFDRPDSHEPRREMSPRVAGKNKWARIEALQRCAQFLTEYADALAAYRDGQTDVVFPFGTYKLRVEGHVCCRAAA